MKTIFTRKTFFTFALILAISPIQTFAQVTQKWKKDLGAKVRWQEVTSLGNIIVSLQGELVGINPADGSILWNKAEFPTVERSSYKEIENSPFFSITNGKSLTLIDQLSGDVVFDSDKAGIDDIEAYFPLYNSDAILVAGKTADQSPLMISVKMSNGAVNWKMNEKFGRIVAANELPNQELLIVTLFYNYKLNSNTGDIIWKEVNSEQAAQIDKMGAFGDLMKNMSENLTQDMEIRMDFYLPAGSDVFYLATQQESKSSMTSSTGEPIINYTNVYYAYNISDGKRVWTKPLEVKGQLSEVAFTKDGVIVLPDNGNRTKINMYDYSTKTGKWGKKGRGIAIKGGIYDYLKSPDGILLVTRTTNKNFLNYLDQTTGTITFDKPVKIDGDVVGIVPLSNGILYITSESMNILDQKNGSLKWSKSINTTPQLTAEKDGKIYVFDNKSRTIKYVDKKTEGVTEVSSTEIKFDGNESPSNIEVMSDGIFIYSEQNVAKVGFDGKLIFQAYYPAPREATWKRALLYASSVRAAYIGAVSYYASGVYGAIEDDVRKENELAGEVVGQISDAYGQLGNAASAYAKSAFKQASQRHKATVSGRDYMFIMAKTDKNIELLKVSKTDGSVLGRINLGKDREPIYAVDDITGQVFYQSDDNEVTSYIVK